MPLTVEVSKDAMRVIRELISTYGKVVLHDPGVPDGTSSPRCYPASEFQVGSSDVLFGTAAGVPLFLSSSHLTMREDLWLLLDVVPEASNPLFLEGTCGVRFVTRRQPGPTGNEMIDRSGR